MSFINIFSEITRGGIRFIGNTLGLSKLTNANQAGTRGSIGAFTAKTGTVPTFPTGTTLNYADNYSTAVLSLPSGSTVLKAELVWGGLCQSRNDDIVSEIGNPITFTTPLTSLSLVPDDGTSQLFTYSTGSLLLAMYSCSADVTAAVAAAQNGTYSVSGVPALAVPIDSDSQDTNHAGWTLSIVFENPSSPLSYLSLWVGGEIIAPNSLPTDIPVTDFLTPPAGSFGARAFISAAEGDAVLTGDQCLFGPNTSSLTPLQGPRNPATNFFASQICNEQGVLDTNGTFGNRNSNPATATNISAGRQGWDITSVDVTSAMQNNQTSAVFRFTTDGDLYVPNALAIAIESRGAFLDIAKSSTKPFVVTGNTITYNLFIKNTGELDAVNVILDDEITNGVTLVPGSISVDGIPQVGDFPITLPTIPPDGTVIVTYKFTVPSFPDINPVVNSANVTYTFFPFPDSPVTRTTTSQKVEVLVLNEDLIVTKSVDKEFTTSGDTLTYTSVVTNNSNVTLNDIFFQDAIPSGTSFIPDSVTVDGSPLLGAQPQTGFLLGDLAPSQSVTVVFKVLVV